MDTQVGMRAVLYMSALAFMAMLIYVFIAFKQADRHYPVRLIA